jgi:hypothetical protein
MGGARRRERRWLQAANKIALAAEVAVTPPSSSNPYDIFEHRRRRDSGD